MRKEKEEIMTSVVTNIKDIVETEEMKENYSSSKIDAILSFLTLKNIARNSKKQIEKYTLKDKNIRGGKRVLAGTRITTKELMLIITEDESKDNIKEYVFNQYPSIDCEEKIIYGLLYEINKMKVLSFILGVIIGR